MRFSFIFRLGTPSAIHADKWEALCTFPTMPKSINWEVCCYLFSITITGVERVWSVVGLGAGVPVICLEFVETNYDQIIINGERFIQTVTEINQHRHVKLIEGIEIGTRIVWRVQNIWRACRNLISFILTMETLLGGRCFVGQRLVPCLGFCSLVGLKIHGKELVRKVVELLYQKPSCTEIVYLQPTLIEWSTYRNSKFIE